MAEEAQSDGITRMARHVLGGHSRDSGPPGSPLGSMIVESRAARAGLKGPETSRNFDGSNSFVQVCADTNPSKTPEVGQQRGCQTIHSISRSG